jgi:amino acid adenylation domain-containing protein
MCLRAIARVTGHRVEDITPDMHLEADLGLDSIKMVELFGVLMQDLPYDRRELLGPGGFFSDLVRVCTVEDLLNSVERLGGGGALELHSVERLDAAIRAAAPDLDLDDAGGDSQTEPELDLDDAGGGSQTERDAPEAKPPGTAQLRCAIVEAIARVSGHRAEDLSDDLSLEADVGFDSLKRVQLLNELSRDLPVSATEALAGEGGIEQLLRAQTIGDLVLALAGLDTSAPELSATPEQPEPQLPATLILADSQVPFLVASMAGVSLCSLCSRVRVRGGFDPDAASAAWGDLIDRHPLLRARFVPPTEGDPQSDWRIDHLPAMAPPPINQVSLTHMSRADQEQALAARLDASLNRVWDLFSWPLQDITAYALSADEYELHFENHHAVSDGLGNQMMVRQFLEAYAARKSGTRPTATAMTSREYNEVVAAVDGWDDRGEDAALDALIRTQGGRVFWNLRGRRPTRGTVKTATRLRRLSKDVTAALVAQVGAMRVPLNSLLVGAYLHALGDVAKLSDKVVLHIPTGGRSHANADATEVLGCFAQNLVLAFDPPRATESWPELCQRVNAEIGHAVAAGLDRAHVRRSAIAARKQPTLGAAHLAAMGAFVRASSKSNLYLPFIGNTRIERRYGPLEVTDYQASTATNPATIDNVLEIFDGALQISSNYDCEMFSAHEVDDLAQAFAARLAQLAAATRAERGAGAAVRPATAEALERVAAIVSEICRRPLRPEELQADLEADLGLDSLDRVRVVHKVRRHAPATDTQKLMACRSVAEMAVALGGEAEPPAPEDVHTSPTAMPYLLFIEQAKLTPDAAAVLDRKGALTYRELDERSNQVARCLAANGVAPRSLVGLLVRPSTEMLVGLVGILKAGCAYVPLDPEYPAQRLAYIVEHAKLTMLVAEQALVSSLLNSIDPNCGVKHVLLVAGDDDGSGGNRSVVAAAGWRAESPQPVPMSASPDDLMVVLYTSGSTGKPKGVMLNHRGYMNRLVWMQKVFQLRPGERIAQKTSPCFDISVWELLWPLMYGATVCPVERSVVRDPWQLTAWMRDSAINVMHFVPSLFAEFVASLDDGTAFPDLRWLVFSGEALPASAIRGWMERCGERVGLANLYGPTEASIDVSWHIIDRKPAADERIPIGRAVDNTELVVLDQALRPCPDGEMGELWIGGVQVAIGYLNQPELTAERFCKVPGAQSPILYRTGDIATRSPDGVFHYHGRTDAQVKIRGFRVELGEIEAVLDAIEGVRENAVLAIDEGEGKLRLVAFVVARPGLDARAIRDLARQKLPDYMVPHRVEFLPVLPKNSNGKLDRGALRSAGPSSPAPAAPVQSAAREPAPAAPVQSAAREPAPAAPVQFAARESAPAAPAPLAAREPAPGPARELAPACDLSPALPAGPAQRWLFSYFPAPYAWFGYSRFRYTRPLIADLLEQALNLAVDRHGALRTTFDRTAEGWRQIVHPPGRKLPVTVFDCAGLSDDEREAEVKRLLEQTCAEMSVDAWPLVALMVLELGNGQYDVLVAGHHLVNDLVSTQILFDEIFTAYDRLVRDPEYRDASPVPPSYTDYVDALEKARVDGTLARHEAWYREHLGRGQPLAIPQSAERGPNVESASRMASVELPEDMSRRLRVDARREHGATVYQLLVAPLYAAVAEWTGQRWVVLSHRTHGRDLGKGRVFFRSVGNFAVNHPVGLDVAPGQAWVDRVRLVAETLAAVPMNGVAYDLVGDALGASLYPDSQLTPIRVNYLGNRTTPVRDGFEFEDAERDQRFALAGQRRTTLIEVFLSFVGDRLRIDLSYSANHHDEPTMQAFLERYARQIEAMLADRNGAAEAITRAPARDPEPPRVEAVSSERPLRGKVAIVTGCGRGIGRESALTLARHGARVVVAAHTREQVEACAREVQALGAEALAVVADLARVEDAERMVAAAIERFGGVDILVNNPGVTPMMAIGESDPTEWRRITEVSLFGAYHCCRAVLPHLRKRGGGKIVNVTADSSHIDYPLLTAYTASQQAVIGLTRALAEEVQLEGIWVNAVCPAMVDSEMLPEALRADTISPAKVAQVIAFLASSLSDAITGETISVHGKQDMPRYGSKKTAPVRAAVHSNHSARAEVRA